MVLHINIDERGGYMPGLRVLIAALLITVMAGVVSAQQQAPMRADTVLDTVWDTVPVVVHDTIPVRDTAFVLMELPERSFWEIYGAPALAVVTAMILLFSFLVSYSSNLNKTRPTIMTNFTWDGLNGHPFLENTSKTDAQAVVKLLVYVNGERIPLNSEDYNYGTAWSVPARERNVGNPGLEATIVAWAKGKKISVATLEPIVELYSFYASDATMVSPRFWAKILGLGSSFIYEAQPKQWNFNHKKNVWVPEFGFRPKSKLPTEVRKVLQLKSQ
jgi:hypothetical protein